MKPIHHALVSARLFGGNPADYVAIHNAFDMSKAALPDMRHRAALHSTDHGRAVMALIFPERIGQASRDEICTQHIHDDQGFDVRLDTWLQECDVPTFARIRRKPNPEIAGFASEPEVAAAQRWGGQPEDYAAVCGYYRLPEALSDHPLAPAISRNAFGIYFSEMAFGPALTITLKTGRTKFVPTRDIGECIALARYGRILTLEDVLGSMQRKDWMMGSRVARSRQRRCRQAGRTDLFSEDMDHSDTGLALTTDGSAIAEVLAD